MERLKTLIQSPKLLENTSSRHLERLEDQLLIWIYKNLSNLEENSIQALQIKVEEVAQIRVDIRSNGQLALVLKDLDNNHLQMTTFIVDYINY